MTLRLGRTNRNRTGSLVLTSLLKKIHVVPMETKTAVDWKTGVKDVAHALGVPKIIMTDPDSSITSNEMDEWLGNNKDVHRVMTRRHAVFAEKAIRFSKRR